MSMENETLKAIRQRRSVRSFKPDQITDKELLTVLEAGTWAPTGMGRQDPVIIAVQNKELANEIRQLNARVMGTKSDPYYGAPTLVLVFAPKNNPNHVKDGSLVLGTMMLAAHSIGLGSCWINRCEAVFGELTESKALRQRLNVPEGYEGVGSLALGYPKGEPHEPKARKKDYFRIIK